MFRLIGDDLDDNKENIIEIVSKQTNIDQKDNVEREGGNWPSITGK